MRNSYIHIAIFLALLMFQGCKSSAPIIDAAGSSMRDSVSVHVVDSYRQHMFLDSFIVSVIRHDTTIHMERVVRDITQAAAQVHDTAYVHKRDTVTISQRPQPFSSARSWVTFILIWFVGVILGIIVRDAWGYR